MSDSIRKMVGAAVTIALAAIVVVGLVQGDKTDEDRARAIGQLATRDFVSDDTPRDAVAACSGPKPSQCSETLPILLFS